MVELRSAVKEDAAAMARLSSQLGYPTTARQAGDRLSALLGLRDHQVMVACAEDGTVMGWIHVFLARRIGSAPFAEIGGFIVADRYRRSGVGTALLEAAEAWASGQGVAKARVRPRSTRGDAHGFYERLGYARVKEQYVYDKSM